MKVTGKKIPILRRGYIQEEDAAKLVLGDDFQNEQCLFISEVKILLDAQREIKAGGDKNVTGVYQSAVDYVNQFARFKNQDTVREVRQFLAEANLEPFEVAQLANLCCEEAEEAKSLIPSLEHKKEDTSIQAILNEMLTLKKFQA
ncbi:RNA polymerase B [Dimargaris cristalligena]|uniref:DNA-directed RNA polymerase II subunit RPB4 n=1 Tax=Dimargaris cristalligena TaxID=215637 RepID=A0A4P9ZW57_9FUNG|nr:RNA polymerase B [Dimargaris cristalligena]RKP37886.1 DNA-directed RNA polymerase II subunit RPB4 [Dimargaris cristalligena]|eukprot:RKP37886.1 DNA-directed RNA polymerase II subunit RPB4 [Dimargaris cristalligena]